MKLKFDRHQIQFRYNYDSFGNALGNAAVKAIREYKPTPSLDDVNKGLRELSAKNSAKALAAVDEQTKAKIRQNQAQTAAGIEAQNVGALDPAMAAIVAENQRKRNVNVEKANAYSDQLIKQAAELGARHQAMKDRIQPTLDRTKIMLNDWTEFGLNVDPSLSSSTDIGPFRDGYRFADSQDVNLTNFIPEGSIEAALRGDFLIRNSNSASSQNQSDLGPIASLTGVTGTLLTKYSGKNISFNLLGRSFDPYFSFGSEFANNWQYLFGYDDNSLLSLTGKEAGIVLETAGRHLGNLDTGYKLYSDWKQYDGDYNYIQFLSGGDNGIDFTSNVGFESRKVIAKASVDAVVARGLSNPYTLPASLTYFAIDIPLGFMGSDIFEGLDRLGQNYQKQIEMVCRTDWLVHFLDLSFKKL